MIKLIIFSLLLEYPNIRRNFDLICTLFRTYEVTTEGSSNGIQRFFLLAKESSVLTTNECQSEDLSIRPLFSTRQEMFV